jgi:hypothetical protein
MRAKQALAAAAQRVEPVSPGARIEAQR